MVHLVGLNALFMTYSVEFLTSNGTDFYIEVQAVSGFIGKNKSKKLSLS